MAYVDENTVKQELEQRCGGGHYPVTFVANEADDESVDADVEIHWNGEDTNLCVQVGGGYMCLNKYEHDADGNFVGSRSLGAYGVQPDDMAKLAHDVNRQLAVKAMAAQIVAEAGQ